MPTSRLASAVTDATMMTGIWLNAASPNSCTSTTLVTCTRGTPRRMPCRCPVKEPFPMLGTNVLASTRKPR